MPLPLKDLEKSKIQAQQPGNPQIKDVLYTDEGISPSEKLIDEHTFMNMAKEQIDIAKVNFDKKKQALNNSNNGPVLLSQTKQDQKNKKLLVQ